MSLNSNRTKKFRRLVLNCKELLKTPLKEDRNSDFNTISTLDKVLTTKNKAVNFNGIEIIEVESHKKYNQIPTLTLESIEYRCSQAYHECQCSII